MDDLLSIPHYRETFIHIWPLRSSGRTEVPQMENTTDTGHEAGGRYASIETNDGDVVIYDHEQPTAWLQSDHAVEIRR